MKFRSFFVRLSGFFNYEKQDHDFDDELQGHLQLHIDDLIKAGMDPVEARRQALIKLGGIESTKEHHREQRRIPIIETIIRDFRYSVRRLTRSPGLTIIAILSLTLGIGANSAIFSVVNTAAFRPLPIKDSEQLVSFRIISASVP